MKARIVIIRVDDDLQAARADPFPIKNYCESLNMRII